MCESEVSRMYLSGHGLDLVGRLNLPEAVTSTLQVWALKVERASSATDRGYPYPSIHYAV